MDSIIKKLREYARQHWRHFYLRDVQLFDGYIKNIINICRTFLDRTASSPDSRKTVWKKLRKIRKLINEIEYWYLKEELKKIKKRYKGKV